MNRRRNIIILAGALAAIVIIAIVVSASKPKGPGLIVSTQTVAYSRFTTRLPETGTLQRPQTQTLAALVGGNLGAFYVHPGDHVTQGQLVATIENPQLASSLATARDTLLSAQARVKTVSETNAALPAQNRSSIVQAQAAVEQAKFALNQARQDALNGSQSGLGYGGSSAEEQRLAANASVANADTNLSEAQRIYNANKDLYANKAISKDQLDSSQAKFVQAQVADNQAHRQRDFTIQNLGRQKPVLQDRARASEDSLRQAQAQLAAAQANAAQSKSGDLDSARADAAKAQSDYQYAADQVARLQIHAPIGGSVQTIASETTDTLRQLQPGDSVIVGQALVTVAGENGLVVRTKVDEQDVASIRVGQRANVSGEDLGGKTLPGHISFISAVAQKSDDPSNTARQVITTVALDKTLPFLRDGMTVDVDILTRDIPHTIAVPNDAIRKETTGNASYVFVIAGGKAKKTSIKTGIANDSQTIVASGVKPGNVIVTENNPLVTDGAAVVPKPKPSASPKSVASGS